jgi:hypothetical protein
MRARWTGFLLAGALGSGLIQCESTRSKPSAIYDDSIELDAAPEPATLAEPESGEDATRLRVQTDPDATAAQGGPTPLELAGAPDAGGEPEQQPDAGPQPTGDVVQQSERGVGRAIRLWTDGRCRSEMLCPKLRDQHGPTYCGEPKLVACPQKLREAWRLRQQSSR